jgi:hypothetical protein
MPMQERYTVRFVCDVRAAPECARLVRRFSDTTGAPGRLPDRLNAIRFALRLARDGGWRVTPVRRANDQAFEVYAVCPLCATLRPDAGPTELRLVPSPLGGG